MRAKRWLPCGSGRREVVRHVTNRSKSKLAPMPGAERTTSTAAQSSTSLQDGKTFLDPAARWQDTHPCMSRKTSLARPGSKAKCLRHNGFAKPEYIKGLLRIHLARQHRIRLGQRHGRHLSALAAKRNENPPQTRCDTRFGPPVVLLPLKGLLPKTALADPTNEPDHLAQ